MKRYIKKIYYALKLYLSSIGFIKEEYKTYIAENDIDYDDIYKLRYEVYCTEKNYLDAKFYEDYREKDKYDQHSISFITRDSHGNIVGTARLILGKGDHKIQAEEYLNLPEYIRRGTVVELSRFIVSKQKRGRGHEVTFNLARELMQYSIEKKIDYWVAIIFYPNWVLFNRLGIPFIIFNEPKRWNPMPEHHVVPVFLNVNESFIYFRSKNKILFNYFSKNIRTNYQKNKKLMHEIDAKINEDWFKYKNFL
ncbi:MAG: GNAT family N-acetyltransferase [Patescibacteria group bacterium]|nr:GNAT family N-acetyltransferase [Patescibacteria group bacterium]